MPWCIVRVIRLPHERGTALGKRRRDGEHIRDSLRDEPSRMEMWINGVNLLGIETYYPMVREMRPVPRNELSRSQRAAGVTLMRSRVVPFLPYLVFVAAGGRHVVERHPGAIGLVSVAAVPAIIADELIDALRLREREGGGAIPGGTPIEFIFRAGDRVRIVHGAMAGQVGIVDHDPTVPLERIDSDTRLRLALDLFGRPTPVTLTVADVAKL